jgi:BirA family biotin operon repressor/biotin-[acetyl-CoA-carboxylase] ligase
MGKRVYRTGRWTPDGRIGRIPAQHATIRAPWSAAAKADRRIGHAIEPHDTIGSTNDRARQLLVESGETGRVILAELQTAGRGRRGRSWSSPPGLNLTFSVALRPDLAAADAWRLAAGAGLAIRTGAAAWAELSLKWPNDVVDADGRKVAGILIETALDGDHLASAVIGIGINVNWRRASMPEVLRPRATSLADLAGEPIDRVALLGRILDDLDARIGVRSGEDELVTAYRAASWLTGRPVAVAIGDRTLTGVARGIGDDGTLTVDVGRGELVSVAYGEVERVTEPVEAVA